EQVAGLAPRLYQRQLFELDAFLDEVARVFSQAICATVYLADAQINEVNQNLVQSRLRDINMNGAQGPEAGGSGFGVIESWKHLVFLLVRGRQFRVAAIDDKNGKQLGRFDITRIAAHEVVSARLFKEI